VLVVVAVAFGVVVFGVGEVLVVVAVAFGVVVFGVGEVPVVMGVTLGVILGPMLLLDLGVVIGCVDGVVALVHDVLLIIFRGRSSDNLDSAVRELA
ncbi:MAG: hypothetical protein WBV37_12730, partial [Nocardioidaceae bacterium]